MYHQIIGGLYISDMDGVVNGDMSEFDRVIGVCQTDCSDDVSCKYDHFDLADGPSAELAGGEYSPSILQEAIDRVVAARIKRETVCVHCHAGVSRSAAVCIGALAVVEGMTFDEAHERVRETKFIQPVREMLDDVEEYVGEKQ